MLLLSSECFIKYEMSIQVYILITSFLKCQKVREFYQDILLAVFYLKFIIICFSLFYCAYIYHAAFCEYYIFQKTENKN